MFVDATINVSSGPYDERAGVGHLTRLVAVSQEAALSKGDHILRRAIIFRLAMVCFVFSLIVPWMPVSTVWAGQPNKPGRLPIDRGLMQRLSNFTLKDVKTGRSHTLYGYRGKKAVVLVFMGTDCPVGNLYAPRLNELNNEFAKNGVVFLGINSNEHETEQDVAKYVGDWRIEFPVLKDPQNLVADAALVERTSEVLVLDGTARVRFRGAIDDQYVEGKAKDAPDHYYLRDALAAILANRKSTCPPPRSPAA